MTRDQAFEFLDRTARGIAEMFGSSCETLVHDMGVPTHPILSIYNGHVSGREVGSTMDIMGIGLELDEQAATTDQVNLAAATPDGRQTKSSTFHMIGEDYNLALGINFDYTSLVFANRILSDLMNAPSDLRSALWQPGDSRQLADLFDQCVAGLGKPPEEFTKGDRLKLIGLRGGAAPSPTASRCPTSPGGWGCPGTRCINIWTRWSGGRRSDRPVSLVIDRKKEYTMEKLRFPRDSAPSKGARLPLALRR